MSKNYRAIDIEVLSGLDPVRRRPGMYTDTSRPNYLAHEVIDNSVDEAIEGHAKRINVKLFHDGSLQVSDDGRGMPVDCSGPESSLLWRWPQPLQSSGLHGLPLFQVEAVQRHNPGGRPRA